MKVRKKYVVPKSYRIDYRLECDLYLLAELTNRSQNDLVNAAIEGFLQDNAEWILQNALVEHFETVLDHTYEEYEHTFKMGGVEVTLDEEDVKYRLHIKTTNDEYEKCISISDEDAEEKLKECLINLAGFIDTESEDTKKHLKNRVDYNDYEPTQKKKKKKVEKK